jgi:hypothetical protein
MKQQLRRIAVILLAVFVVLAVTPTKAYASQEEGVAIACGEDQNGQQKCAVLGVGAIYWGEAEWLVLTQGEFVVFVVFIVVSYAVWDAILNGGNPPPAECYNCQDGFLNRVNGLPAPAQ